MKHYLFKGTKDEFIAEMRKLKGTDQYLKILQGSTLITEEDFGEGANYKDSVHGYLFVHSTFFPLSNVSGEFDPSQYEVLSRAILDKEDYPAASEDDDQALVTKGYLDKHTSFTNLN